MLDHFVPFCKSIGSNALEAEGPEMVLLGFAAGLELTARRDIIKQIKLLRRRC